MKQWTAEVWVIGFPGRTRLLYRHDFDFLFAAYVCVRVAAIWYDWFGGICKECGIEWSIRNNTNAIP